MAGDLGPFQGRDAGRRKGVLLLGAGVSIPLLESQGWGETGPDAPTVSFPFPETVGVECASGPWNL